MRTTSPRHDVKAVAVPRATFDDLIARSAGFRRFVFTAFSQRVTNLFKVIENIVFARLAIRLAHRPLELAGNGEPIAVTQQELAPELGAVREVVSRLLNEFQSRGWLTLMQGGMIIKDRAAIAGIAASSLTATIAK